MRYTIIDTIHFLKEAKEEIILKIKDKYLDESSIDKDSPRDAMMHVKEFRLQDKATKKLKLGLFVDEVMFYDKSVVT